MTHEIFVCCVLYKHEMIKIETRNDTKKCDTEIKTRNICFITNNYT